MVFAEYWQNGYATEACRLALGFLFERFQINEVESLVDTRNEASMRLLQTLGFIRVGTIKQADFFKGSPSDEYRYKLTLGLT
jgi:RimJ/RimL family protein N-acetyltransferase